MVVFFSRLVFASTFNELCDSAHILFFLLRLALAKGPREPVSGIFQHRFYLAVWTARQHSVQERMNTSLHFLDFFPL